MPFHKRFRASRFRHPGVRPPRPTSGHTPSDAARPAGAVRLSNSEIWMPGSASATRFAGSSLTLFIRERFDYDPVVASRVSGEAMTPAAHRNTQALLPSELDRAPHVFRRRTSRDHRGMLVVAPIPHPPRRFVVLVAGQDEAAFEARTKLLGRGGIDARGESPRSSAEHAPRRRNRRAHQDALLQQLAPRDLFNQDPILTPRFQPVL